MLNVSFSGFPFVYAGFRSFSLDSHTPEQARPLVRVNPGVGRSKLPPLVGANSEKMWKKRGRVTVFRQIFRNFGFAELTLHSEIKRKANFPFVFRSFFRNFAA